MQPIQEATQILVNRDRELGSPFLGSCFCFRRSDVILTAAHLVIGRARDSLAVAPAVVGWDVDNLPVDEIEIHPSADVALLRIRPSGLTGSYAFYWYGTLLAWGEQVQAFGYPEDTHGDSVAPTPRMFVGTIQREVRYSDGRGTYHGIELSFPSPQGLSGGPVCSIRNQTQAIGLMAANQDALTYRGGFERLDSSGRWIPTERDVIRYGIAVSMSAIGPWLDERVPPNR